MSGLPTGWVGNSLSRLMDGGLFIDGDWVETKDQDENGEIRLTQLADVGEGCWRNRSNRSLTRESATRLSCTYLDVGDVLVARMPDPLGRACIFPGDPRRAITVVDVCILRPPDGSVNLKWLMWFINSPPMRAKIEALQSGTTRRRISRKNFGSLTIPIPPRDEQRQIAEVIEEQFSRLDAAEASLARALRNLKRLRAASIAAALVGDWPEVEFASIIKSLRNGIFASRPTKNPPGIPIFRISAVRPMQLDVEDVRYALLPAEEAEGYFVEPGDLLITRYSGNPSFVGASAVVPRLVTPTLHPDKLIRVVVDRAKARSEFVSLTLNNGIARKQIESRLKTTAGQVGISGSQLRSVVLRLPPLATQQDIVEDISWKLSACDAEMKGIDIALRRSQQLRRAILEAAFAGRLVPQDRYAGLAPAGAVLEASVDATRRSRGNETEVIGKAEVSFD